MEPSKGKLSVSLENRNWLASKPRKPIRGQIRIRHLWDDHSYRSEAD
jgi:hypothetical protein